MKSRLSSWIRNNAPVWALGLGIFSGAAASPSASTAPPNIVFILADDLGWTDLGCMGSRYYETPHIDQLAAQGMRFTAYYNCQNCAPTRAALMSGQYAPRTGVYTVGSGARGKAWQRQLIPAPNRTKLPRDKITVARALKQAGYATGLFGKWHLGTDGPYHPAQRGFDEAIVVNHRHFNFKPNPPVPVPPGAYLADWLTDHAVDFIRRHRAEPFFLYLPHFAVHAPLQAKKEGIARFREKPPVDGHRNPVYAAMIASVDDSVGRVMACLDELGLAERTVLIFSSDNGGLGGYTSSTYEGRRGITDNWPLSQGKGSLHEGGIRVPFIVRWPGVIKPGSRCDAPAIHVDLYPTFLELAGVAPPEDYPLDGRSLLPLWRGERDADRPPLFWHFPGYLQPYIKGAPWRTTPVSVVRAGDYKLMEFFEDGHLELYNLATDLGERHNLADTQPEKRDELLALLRAWQKRLHAPLPRRK
jgi:arylsulfatase A-like enzyme